MNRFNIIGNILDSSGYSRHTRELFHALDKIADVRLATGLINGWERFVDDRELLAIKKEEDASRTNIVITNPMFWRINLTAKRNWVYLVWEGDKIPKWMADECFTNKDIDKIIVPSKHTYDALVNGLQEIDYSFRVSRIDVRQMVLDKTVIIPHGVDLEKFYPIHSPSNPALKGGTTPGESVIRAGTPFRFLMCKGFTNMEDRGGVQYGIQAYLKEFTSKDNVELIIKLNSAYGIPDFNKLFPELSNKDNPKITIITETLDDKQLNELYNSCDVFVSPTRAESFNLPCLEALACGKICITTSFGGQTDFIEDGKTGVLVKYKLEEVKHDLFYEGIKWATPDIKDLRSALRSLYQHKNNTDWVEQSENCINKAKQYTWDNTAQRIEELL